MADPLREPVSWLAIELIETRLKGVTKAANYHTDLGLGTVTTDPSKKTTADDVMHTLIDAGDIAEKPESSGKRTQVSDMDVTIEVIVPFSDTENAARLAHRARSDVIRAIGGGVIGTEQGIRKLEVTGSGFAFGITADGASAVIAQVTARAGLAEPTLPAI